MGARRTNTSILVIGLIGVILLGIMMWYMGGKIDLGVYSEVATAISESCPINGTELSIEPAFSEDGKEGVDVFYFPSAGILGGLPDSDLNIEAERVALYVYEEADSAAQKARRSPNTFDGLNAGASYRKIADGFVNVTMKSRGGLFGCSENEEFNLKITHWKISDRMTGWFKESTARWPEAMRFEYRLPRIDKPGILKIYLSAEAPALFEQVLAEHVKAFQNSWKYGLGKIVFIDRGGKRFEFAISK